MIRDLIEANATGLRESKFSPEIARRIPFQRYLLVGARFMYCIAVFMLVLLPGCGSSTAPEAATSTPALSAAQCQVAVASPLSVNDADVSSADELRSLQAQTDLYNGGSRLNGSSSELAYIDWLVTQLTQMGATSVSKEAYTFSQWSPASAALAIKKGPAPGGMPIAGYIPYSGSTGPQGITGQLVYLPEFSLLDLTSVIATILQDPANIVVSIEYGLFQLLQNLLAGGISLAQLVASLDLKGKVVMYDVPRLDLPVGTLAAQAQYVNNSSGTLGQATLYSRPFLDMVLIYTIDAILSAAGASAVIGVIDYPPAAADGSYYPFFSPDTSPSVPGVYLDRSTGTALKEQIDKSGLSPIEVKLTLDASRAPAATSYNISADIPGLCPQELLLSSHSDGPNSIEDNGPVAILAIAKHFLAIPKAQRLRGLHIVFTGGHFEGSVGIAAYIAKHQADLTENTLGAIEIEHLGAREWLELSPGIMGLDGLPEPQVLLTAPGTAFAREARTFATNFDRSVVIPPILPVGEGQAWHNVAKLPLVGFIAGPLYLLNDAMPEVTTDFTDYDLFHRQVRAFIQMISNLETDSVATLRGTSK